MAVNSAVKADMGHRVSEGCMTWGAMKGVIMNRGLGMKAKRRLDKGIIVPTVLYGAEAWDTRITERQVECLRDVVFEKCGRCDTV